MQIHYPVIINSTTGPTNNGYTSTTSNNTGTPERWCTTPFFTRTRKFEDVDQGVFLALDLLILVLNLISSMSIMRIIRLSIIRIRRKPCMWLLYHLAFNDVMFTIVAQSVYAAKVLVPTLPCMFDLIAMFFAQTLANTSIALIVQVSFLRYLSAKHMLSMKTILTLRRAKLMLFAGFVYGTFFSGILLVGSIIDNVIIINLPPCMTDLIVPIIIPVFYNKALRITLNRSFEKRRRGLAEATLRQATIYTLVTYVPFRLCFFVTSTFKMIYTVELDNDSTYLLQFFHSCSYLILCLAPIGNSFLYVLSDRRARRIIKEWYRSFKMLVTQVTRVNLLSGSIAADL